jgi:hypothetical protein
MRGRRPAGPEAVAHLDGSALAKERLQVLWETLAGRCRVVEACARLGISEPRFHQLRQQMLGAALAALEPRSAGRPARRPTAAETHARALEQQLVDKDLELRTAQARAEIALALPQVRHAPPAPEKKTPPRARPRRRRGKRNKT